MAFLLPSEQIRAVIPMFQYRGSPTSIAFRIVTLKIDEGCGQAGDVNDMTAESGCKSRPMYTDVSRVYNLISENI